jgi:DNA-binding response OmpR family regulator
MLSPVRVLIVEDDPELAGLLRDGLREHRIDPTVAMSFAEGREQAAAGDYDVVVLDVRLPGGSGFELCRNQVTTPVLMLTALDAVDDRVRGLEVGADDYLTKVMISEDSARAIVLREVPGGRVQALELEWENGALIYSWDIKVRGKPGITEVHVSAIDGKVLAAEHENH